MVCSEFRVTQTCITELIHTQNHTNCRIINYCGFRVRLNTLYAYGISMVRKVRAHVHVHKYT